MASSPASPNHRPGYSREGAIQTLRHVKGNSFSAKGEADAQENHQNAVGTLRPNDGLALSSVEVRFVDDDEERDGAVPGTSQGGINRSKEKIGHRRVDRQGEVSYKRVPTNALMGAIQLGIANSIGAHEQQQRRDILLRDFRYIDSVAFPSDGSQTPHTPPHSFGDFRFKTYAPIAFRYFRELFKIKPADFMNSLCSQPLKELSNPGASGSIFYVSSDDKFIIKTIQHKEAEFLRTLLPGYYLNLQQNPRTLLPKFFGLFCYQSLGKNIRLLVMNNLLPYSIKMHEKFDLKGSTYKRAASRSERAKANPTLKDLDFNELYKSGILLDSRNHEALMDTIKRDCLVLESFAIMDYSLLMGVHNIDMETGVTDGSANSPTQTRLPLDETLTLSEEHPDTQSSVRTEAWQRLQLDFNTTRGPHEEGGVPGRNAKGERILVFLGIIDILQSYRLFKKLEHTWKSVFHDGDSISVTNPTFYAARFQAYMREHVFVKASADLSYQQRNPNKFRSLVHSFMAIRQTPARLQQPQPQLPLTRLRSGTEEEVQRLEFAEPLLTGQRGAADRRSYNTPYAVKTTPGPSTAGAAATVPPGDTEKKKKKERLFAPADDSEAVALPQP